ncbi:class I SAM-dependent methyltransferase [Muricauda sp. CAU 1633]|uniref:class I SAM-dependent methyltransferase n=1 Tax=Allomuricauda sp. CAU 1633 TaxID=2816036 RepID=UPI001A904D66|nr:class I SAM-dependent methyltransferase [Muricauda sp. CAU 1633]MBO0323212.1 class I SAM-dependent methyltransferase [Muricauda sp. CAU 1633]
MSFFRSFLLIFIGSVIGLQAQYTESDWEERDKWMKTNALLAMTAVGAGDKVADIGCHEGYLSIHLAKKVSNSGRVYAVDIREDRLQKLRTNARDRDLKNIVTILGETDNPKLPEGELDAVFIFDTYHEMDAHEEILQHVKRALKPGGQLMLMEKLKDWVRGESRERQVSSHSLGPEYVREELKQAGFTIISEIEDHGDWERETDKQMWVILAKKTG